MRVFLVGEGPSDIGDLANEPAWRDRRPRDGFFQPLLRKLRPDDRLEFDGQKITPLGKERFSDLRSGLSRQSRAAYLLAERDGCDVLVVTHDVDRRGQVKASKAEAAKKTKEIREALEAGIEAGRAAAGGSLQVVIGTPCRCVEAWALGDLDAVKTAGRLRARPKIPKKPEELTGAPHDPKSNHPKSVLTRLLDGAVGRDAYAAIAAAADVDEIRTACPQTFEPFARDVAALTGAPEPAAD